MLRRQLAFAAAVFLCVPGSLFADLEFEKSETELHLGFFQRDLLEQFPFTNDGAETVTILKMESDCGCSTAALSKKVYYPGESGVIMVHYAHDPNNPVKNERKRNLVVIETDQAEKPRITLTIHLKRPGDIWLSRRELTWSVTEPAAAASESPPPARAQTVEIETAASINAATLRLEYDRTLLEIHAQPPVDGRRLTLNVRPLSRANPIETKIRILTPDSPTERNKARLLATIDVRVVKTTK